MQTFSQASQTVHKHLIDELLLLYSIRYELLIDMQYHTHFNGLKVEGALDTPKGSSLQSNKPFFQIFLVICLKTVQYATIFNTFKCWEIYNNSAHFLPPNTRVHAPAYQPTHYTWPGGIRLCILLNEVFPRVSITQFKIHSQ